jgi:hypothetical protein
MLNFLVNAYWVFMIIGIVFSFFFVSPLPFLFLAAIFGVVYYINPKL